MPATAQEVVQHHVLPAKLQACAVTFAACAIRVTGVKQYSQGSILSLLSRIGDCCNGQECEPASDHSYAPADQACYSSRHKYCQSEELINFTHLRYQADVFSDAVSLSTARQCLYKGGYVVSAAEVVYSTSKGRNSAVVYKSRMSAVKGTDFASTAFL